MGLFTLEGHGIFAGVGRIIRHMFTGLISLTSEVTRTRQGRLAIAHPQDPDGEAFDWGESVAVNGCCLTLVGISEELSFDVSPETLERTTLGDLVPGDPVNVERAMRTGDRLGGHFVQGHVDCVGHVRSVEYRAGGWTFEFEMPWGEDLVVDKGSITVDGVSLTVVKPQEKTFTVAVIPATYECTNFRTLQRGDKVNLEFDVLAKHIKRLIELST